MPLPSNVKGGIKRISQLAAGPEMEEYKMMMMFWREEKVEFCEIEKELSSLSEKILPQLRGKSTVVDILLYLNQRYRPSDQARRQQVIMQWNGLKEKSSDKETYNWLDQRELVYADTREINLPHMASSQAQLDFLHKIRPIDLAWATTKLIMINEAINSSGLVPDL
ncbi:hypothetical protein GcM1_215015 [Golovinomyces cichoracearum]|uniref:Uncharacterized protein n=1 Tax=Golovinomyces cichoracearum TaxID=62708 RepID=A0A420ITP4_9PEZI|nr:hypothetical protein GcM1_215015 [Golovinomyces cichoracearum]